jgi:RecA-family ATPase
MRLKFKKSKDIKPLVVEVVNKGYIPLIAGAYNVIAGEGGVGKSLIALKSMIIYLLDNRDKKAIMFMTEDGIFECVSRCKKICENMNLKYSDFDNRIFWFTLEELEVPKLVKKGVGGVKEKDNEAIDDIINFSITEDVGFICFDPLRAFHELEENSNDDMPYLTREIFPMSGKITGAVVLVLHHSAKGDGSAVRGASSIGNDARIAWVLAKVVEKNNMTKKTTTKEGMNTKIHLSVYKDNFNIAKFCNIRDKDGLIYLPTEKTIDNIGGGQIPCEVIPYEMTGV